MRSSKLYAAGIELNCGVLEHFQFSSEEHVKGVTRVLALSSQSQRKPFPSSKRERRCARLNRETVLSASLGHSVNVEPSQP